MVWQARIGRGCRGEASHGKARQARRGLAGRGKVWLGRVCRGEARRARSDMVRSGLIGFGR
jgi:hypothetical protein